MCRRATHLVFGNDEARDLLALLEHDPIALLARYWAKGGLGRVGGRVIRRLSRRLAKVGCAGSQGEVAADSALLLDILPSDRVCQMLAP